MIHEIYANGAVAQDGRLKPGDQILEVCYSEIQIKNISRILNSFWKLKLLKLCYLR